MKLLEVLGREKNDAGIFTGMARGDRLEKKADQLRSHHGVSTNTRNSNSNVSLGPTSIEVKKKIEDFLTSKNIKAKAKIGRGSIYWTFKGIKVEIYTTDDSGEGSVQSLASDGWTTGILKLDGIIKRIEKALG